VTEWSFLEDLVMSNVDLERRWVLVTEYTAWAKVCEEALGIPWPISELNLGNSTEVEIAVALRTLKTRFGHRVKGNLFPPYAQ
jgi:hypothetical protein